MTRYKLIIEYDGTDYVGWQRQINGLSVQEVVEKAIHQFCGENSIAHCAGRTDTGVHALGQVAHVDLPKVYEDHQVCKGINFYLKPHAISIIEAQQVSEEFNARFSAIERSYIYHITNRPSPLTVERHYAWHVARPLDAQAMHKAAQILVGKHDFTTFRATHCQSKSPLKTLDQLDVKQKGQKIEIFARARSFLHHQVRNMVGTLALVGDGKWTIEEVEKALKSCDRKAGGPTAPPQGLYLRDVKY